MRQIIFFILILSVAVHVGCKEKVLPIPAPELKLGTISDLTVNGSSLPRTGMELIIDGQYFRKCNNIVYDITLTHQTVKFTTVQEYFFLSILPVEKLGKIKLSPERFINDTCDISPRSSFFMMRGKDQLVATYDLLKSADNYVFIDSFDKTKNEVSGTFNVTYIATGTSETSRAIYPDTIRLENAKFKVPLNN